MRRLLLLLKRRRPSLDMLRLRVALLFPSALLLLLLELQATLLFYGLPLLER